MSNDQILAIQEYRRTRPIPQSSTRGVTVTNPMDADTVKFPVVVPHYPDNSGPVAPLTDDALVDAANMVRGPARDANRVIRANNKGTLPVPGERHTAELPPQRSMPSDIAAAIMGMSPRTTVILAIVLVSMICTAIALCI